MVQFAYKLCFRHMYTFVSENLTVKGLNFNYTLENATIVLCFHLLCFYTLSLYSY